MWGTSHNGLYLQITEGPYLDANHQCEMNGSLGSPGLRVFLSFVFEAQRFKSIGLENQRVIDLDA